MRPLNAPMRITPDKRIAESIGLGRLRYTARQQRQHAVVGASRFALSAARG
jgi:hypothetical protein